MTPIWMNYAWTTEILHIKYQIIFIISSKHANANKFKNNYSTIQINVTCHKSKGLNKSYNHMLDELLQTTKIYFKI